MNTVNRGEKNIQISCSDSEMCYFNKQDDLTFMNCKLTLRIFIKLSCRAEQR